MAFPQNYEPPKGDSTDFLKLEEGDNRFRVISEVVTGYEYWNKDNQPVRNHEFPGPKPEDMREKGKFGPEQVRTFIAMVVWHPEEKRVKVAQFNQASIQRDLYNYEQDPEWGDIRNYDVSVHKSLKGDKTEYSVKAYPPTPLPDEAKQAYEESDFDLNKIIFGGEYPRPKHTDPDIDPSDIPFGDEPTDDPAAEASPFK